MAVGRASLAMVALLVVACQASPRFWPFKSSFSSKNSQDMQGVQDPQQDSLMDGLEELHRPLEDEGLTFDDAVVTLQRLKSYMNFTQITSYKTYNQKGFLSEKTVGRLLLASYGPFMLVQCGRYFERVNELKNEISKTKYHALASYLEKCKEGFKEKCAESIEERNKAKEELPQELENVGKILYANELVDFYEVETAIKNALVKLNNAMRLEVSIPPEHKVMVKDLREIKRICTGESSQSLLQEADKMMNFNKNNPNLVKYLKICRERINGELIEYARNVGGINLHKPMDLLAAFMLARDV
jgi:hypothetical protein